MKTTKKYKYTDEDDKTNYGHIILSVQETDKSYTFELVENTMRFRPARFDMMFKDSNKVRILKKRSVHAIIFCNGFFVIYPYRDGIPYLFEEME